MNKIYVIVNIIKGIGVSLCNLVVDNTQARPRQGLRYVRKC